MNENKYLEIKNELVDIIHCAFNDWDDYSEECYEKDESPVEDVEDFVADAIIKAGYVKQSATDINDGSKSGDCKNCNDHIGEIDLAVLNCFRNRYYTEGNETERGIIANAINNILPILVSFKNGEYCKRSEVIDEFAERLKEAPIKCGLPMLGLSTKEEIEEYFNDIMLQVRDAIDDIAKKMKGGERECL